MGVCVHVCMSFLLPFAVVLFLLCFVEHVVYSDGKPFLVLTFTYHFDNEVKAKVKAYGSLKKTSHLFGTKFNIRTQCTTHTAQAKNDSSLQYNFIYFICLWSAQRAHYGYLFFHSSFFFGLL